MSPDPTYFVIHTSCPTYFTINISRPTYFIIHTFCTTYFETDIFPGLISKLTLFVRRCSKTSNKDVSFWRSSNVQAGSTGARGHPQTPRHMPAYPLLRGITRTFRYLCIEVASNRDFAFVENRHQRQRSRGIPLSAAFPTQKAVQAVHTTATCQMVSLLELDLARNVTCNNLHEIKHWCLPMWTCMGSVSSIGHVEPRVVGGGKSGSYGTNREGEIGPGN